jgi:hypothetical protein
MRLSATRSINRPVDEVAEFFFDATNNPKWQDGMVSCEWLMEGPVGVGSTYEQHARFMGRDIRSVFVVTEFQPGRSIEIETIASTFPIQVHRWVEPTGPNSCTVNAEITGGPEGFLRILEPLMRRKAQQSVDADYDRLRALLTSS